MGASEAHVRLLPTALKGVECSGRQLDFLAGSDPGSRRTSINYVVAAARRII